jgi:hypothetical protein
MRNQRSPEKRIGVIPRGVADRVERFVVAAYGDGMTLPGYLRRLATACPVNQADPLDPAEVWEAMRPEGQ